MALFATLPATINDGTNDHTIAFKAPYPEGKALCGEFFETGASSAALTVRLFVKQDESNGGVYRRLSQLKFPVVNGDGVVVDVITVNVTIAHKPATTDTDCIKALTMQKNILSTAGFIAALVNGHVS